MRAIPILGIGLALVGIGVSVSGFLSTVLIALGIIVCVSSPFARRKEESESPKRTDSPKRIGYIGRESSKGNLRRAKFGKDLDVGMTAQARSMRRKLSFLSRSYLMMVSGPSNSPAL